MRKFILVAALLVTVQFGYSQGTVVFNNRDVANSIDARIFDVGGAVGADASIVAQLWGSAPGGTLVPLGDPVALRSTPPTGLGYLNTTGLDLTRVIEDIAPGGAAQVQMRAWSIADGATYNVASVVSGARIGSSGILNLATTGGAGSPPSLPVPLVGLTGFTLTVVPIPEPSTIALAVLGGALILRRRKL